MRNQKGVTLTALVIYMGILSIVLAVMATVSNYFYSNIREVKDAPKYVSEINKFSMFFIKDVKNNTSITSINDTSVIFEDGTTYKLTNGEIYRNDKKIAKYVKNLTFTKSTYTVNATTKNIINVNMTLGNNKEEFNQSIDFVLKYW